MRLIRVGASRYRQYIIFGRSFSPILYIFSFLFCCLVDLWTCCLVDLLTFSRFVGLCCRCRLCRFLSVLWVCFVGLFCGFVYLNGLVALVGRVGRRSFCRTGDNKIKTRGLMVHNGA